MQRKIYDLAEHASYQCLEQGAPCMRRLCSASKTSSLSLISAGLI